MCQQVVEALRIVLNTVKAKENTLDEHKLQPFVGGQRLCGDRCQAFLESFDDPVDMRKGDLLLTGKVQVNTAFSDPDLIGKIVDRHFLIPVSSEQPIRSIEDR